MTSKRWWLLGCGLGVPLFCATGALLLLRSTFGSVAGTHDREIASARAAGIPLDAAELRALAKVPDRENAAPLYRSLWKELGEDPEYKKQRTIIDKALARNAKPAEIAAMPEAVAALQPALAKIGRAADLPHCDFKRDWDRGPALAFPEMAQMKEWAKLLAADAEFRSRRGDWKGALKSIQRAQRIGRHSGEDPILIGMLVNIAIEAIVERSFDRLIQQHGRNPEFVSAAMNTLKGFGEIPSFRKAMYGEVVLGRAAVRQLHGRNDFSMTPEGENQRPSAIERAFFQSKTVQDALDAKLVGAYREMIVDLPKDPAAWEKAQEVAGRVGAKIEADHSVANFLNRILFPVFDQAAEAVGQAQMRRRMTETSLLLLQERIRSGAYPLRLPNWGEARIDPFTGKPFHYRHEGAGVLFYSVGRDRSDDEGVPRDPSHSQKPFDEVIKLK